MLRNRFTLFTAACLAALLMASLPAAGQQVLPGHVPEAVNGSQVLSALPAGTQLSLAIGLPLRNQDELDSLLVQLSDPESPNFRHYLTPEQFAAEFGPTEQDYQALIQFVQEKGLVVTGTHPNRVLLDVSGAVPDIENAFHVKMMSYQHPVRGKFFAPDREPSLDLDVQVLHVSGLDNFVVPKPMGLKTALINEATPFVTGSGPDGLFIGKDFRAAYAPSVTLTGSGQVVGLLEYDGFYAGDVTKNAAAAGLTAPTTQTVLLDGFNGAPGDANIEVILDIMMASYMAPGLTKIMVYEGYYPDDILNKMATDNLAQQLSSSWGFGIDSTTEQIYKEYIAQGQSMMQASGDDGAYMNGVMTPSDDPNLTVVGGTSLTTSGAGGPWSAESAWSGSGGGISTTYAIPSYQQSTNMAASHGSTKMRNLPDVALTADVQLYLICDNGMGIEVGGTSAAAPLWAGFVALANQQAAANGKARVGFLNPLVYTIGNSSNYASDFHDITQGNNGYAAVTGYDLTTGWGSPAGQHLINDLTGTTTAASFTLTSSASALSVKQAGTGTATVTVVPKNGFSSSVSLAVSGLPTGVTAAFSPSSATTTSTVTFTATASAAVGTYPLTIKGTSGSLSSTATISLTVVAPSFSLSASAASLTVRQGASGTSTITVSGQNGFSGSVSLAVTGLPTGVTAAFNPSSTTTTSTLTFTVAAATAAGTYPLTVKGTSGTLSATATISLTVVAPSFSLSASVSSLTVRQGASATSTITVSGKNGFSSSVSLAVTGLPAGVTAAFSPASTASTSTITLTVAASTAAGTYPLTIKGTSGSLSSTATISLTVVAPGFSLSALPASLTVSQGGSGSSTISVSGQNGFSGSVSLAVSGLPTGVTAAFSPASTTSASTVMFTVAASTAAGTYPLTIKGISGSLSATAAISLTVQTPGFSLTTSVASLDIILTGSGSSMIGVTGKNGFNGSVSLAATGLPAGVTAAFSAAGATDASVLTISVSSTAKPGSYTVVVTGTSGKISSSTSIALTVTAPVFDVAFEPVNLGLARGQTAGGTVILIAQKGISNVTLTASGLPSGVTAAFGAWSATGTSEGAFTASSTAAAGKYPITVTGAWNGLTTSTSFELTVLPPTAGTTLVNLSPAYNIMGLTTDGLPYSGGGLDGGLNGMSTTYSANLIGAQQQVSGTIGGTVFAFGPANAPDAVSGATVPLPAGRFSAIQLLATAVNGNQQSQGFRVTYTDGTSSTFTQSVSDWFTPQNFSGETKALIMPYRDTGVGQLDVRTFYLYEYTFTLNSGKTVASITLPGNRNVVVLAATLTNSTASVRSKLLGR